MGKQMMNGQFFNVLGIAATEVVWYELLKLVKKLCRR